MAQDDNVTGGGSGSTDFQTLIPTEFKDHPSLAPIKDMQGLVKSYISAQEMVGKNKVVVPSNDATPEEWNTFFSKVGRPENPDQYGIKKPDSLPEGFDVPDEFINFMKQMFHKHGLTPKQASGIFNEYNEFAAKNFSDERSAIRTKRTEELEALKKEWGAAYDSKFDSARRAVRAFLSDAERKWLEDNGLNVSPHMVKIFAGIGEQLKEPGVEGGNGDGGGMGPITPAQAQQEIGEKMSDPQFMEMYLQRNHPRHQWAVEQMMKLHKFAHPQ